MAKTPVNRLAAALLFAFLFGFSNAAKTADSYPLRPADMSSPRATIESFIASMDDAYRVANEIVGAYAASNRLYLTAEERQRLSAVRSNALKSVQSLDTSNISPVLREVFGAARAIQLKEILDRIGLPPIDAIPDRDAIMRSSAKRWRMPNTEIDFVLIENGPRAGDFLVSADTIDRLPGFYERVKDLPYLPGPAKQLSDTYRGLSGNQSATIFEIIWNSPVGLDRILPTRWVVRLPDWAKARVAGVAVWQWVGFVLGLCIGALFILGAYLLARRLDRGKPADSGRSWASLLTPIAVIAVAWLLIPLLSMVMRIGGTPYMVVAVAQTVAVFTSAAWVSVTGAGIVGEAIAASEHLASRSLDSQLIRLSARFVGVVIALGLLMEAASELGFPSYSVLAGLGVGGLAIALAARDSLANLLGSVLIMFEKPFRVGHRIRVGGSEGTVEDVGFRSTRIRTPDNSLISIPNNAVVNATVENLSVRTTSRQRLLIQITYDTPREKMEAFTLGIKQVIDEHPLTRKDNFNVRFNEFGESSLNILVVFHLMVANITEELTEREGILYQIMAIAERLEIEFAFPTRTLHVETKPATAISGSAVTEAPAARRKASRSSPGMARTKP